MAEACRNVPHTTSSDHTILPAHGLNAILLFIAKLLVSLSIHKFAKLTLV